jgi:ParB-like chromosome segregation protein Spo0J
MAILIKAGSDAKRRERYFVDPYQIEVREELRGRHLPPREQDILYLAESMLKYGQRQCVEARRKEGGKIVLVAGFTRTAAARLIRDGFVGSDGEQRQDKDWKLQVVVSDCNDETAFLRNVVENAARHATSPIDDAINQSRLRDQHGMSNTEIAGLYGKTAVWVGRLQGLLQLDSATQLRVQSGDLAVSVALDALELPAEKRAEVLAAATKATGKVDGAAVKAQVREHHLNDNAKAGQPVAETETEAEENPDGKGKPRSLKEVREYFDWIADAKSGNDPALRTFARTLLAWLRGTKTDDALDSALETLLDAKRAK